jgi:transcriptional regulator with XRE-family HTH domain
MPEHVPANLATNLKRLREEKGLTQQELSDLSKVPRPTVAHLESGSANPTIGVLLRVASGLQVPLEQLLRAPSADVVHYPHGSLPILKRAGVTVRQLMPNPNANVAIERIELAQGSRHSARPAKPGTRRFFACEHGELQLSIGAQSFIMKSGDVLILVAEESHDCLNRGRRTAIAYSVTVPAV